MRIFQKPMQIDRKSNNLILIISSLVLISLACNLPTMAKQAGPSQPEGNIETRVAQTVIAREGGQDTVDQGGEGEDNAASPASETPDVTDTPTLTPTITETPTPEVAMVYSSENTNCRTGPNTVFPWIFTLDQGESAEAVARGSVGDYWYIKQPDFPTTICALWGKYATPSGPYEALPVWTPIPTPTPTPGLNFTISFDKYIGSCFSWYTVQYRIDNTGGFKLESWRTTSTDHTGGSNPIENFQDKFYGFSDCTHFDTQKDLTPGEAYYLNALFDHDPAGHDITVKVKVCTKDGLGGDCLVKNFRHTP